MRTILHYNKKLLAGHWVSVREEHPDRASALKAAAQVMSGGSAAICLLPATTEPSHTAVVRCAGM